MDYGIALLMGLGGSLHCLGMCGPIALSLPFQDTSMSKTLYRAMSYNLGRVVGYGIFGIIPGLLGHLIYIGEMQSSLSILLGVLIIAGVIGVYSKNIFPNSGLIQKMDYKIQTLMRRLLRVGSRKKLFQIGIVNAFIPCGMVYIALAGSVLQPSVLQSVVYMMAFGIGTIPLMLVPCLSSNLIKVRTRRRLKKIVPIFMCGLGILFLMRGLGVEIPISLVP